MFTSDELKEMVTEIEEKEKEATKSRLLVREFRIALSQPIFNDVESLGQLRRMITDNKADTLGVIQSDSETVLALIDKGRSENQSLAQFKDTLFHLFRLTEMQITFSRGAKELFGSPAATEVAQMMQNKVVAEMNDILATDDEDDDETSS